QRVDQGGPVLGVDRQRRRGGPPVQPVGPGGEVRLVGTAAVVVGAARADGEAQRHRLQGARLVAGDLQPLDVRGEIRRVPAEGLQRDKRRAPPPTFPPPPPPGEGVPPFSPPPAGEGGGGGGGEINVLAADGAGGAGVAGDAAGLVERLAGEAFGALERPRL